MGNLDTETGNVALEVDEIELPDELPFSDASNARAIVLPYFLTKIPEVNVQSGTVFCKKGEASLQGRRITIDLLAQLLDERSWWSLVATAVKHLKIDPTLLRYRGNAACFPPVVRLSEISTTYVDLGIDQRWFSMHGYAYQGSGIFKKAVDRPDLVNYALVFPANEKVSRTKTGEAPSVALLERQKLLSQGSESLIPVFFLHDSIEVFHNEWEACSKHQRIYPVLRCYFETSRTNSFFVRFIPCDHADKVPQAEPAMAFYDMRSAPAACHALMFNMAGPKNDFLYIHESNHAFPVVDCQADPVRI